MHLIIFKTSSPIFVSWYLSKIELRRMLNHVKPWNLFSNVVVSAPHNCWELRKQLISGNFQNGNFEIISITVMKIVLIEVFFLSSLLNKQTRKKKKMKIKIKNGIPSYLHTILKLALFKTREAHFSVVWVIELSIIMSFRLGKVKDFWIVIVYQS